MNRPRNRQPKVQRGGGLGERGNRGGSGQRGGRPNAPRPEYHPVPSVQQVKPGAAVSIVLKQDQPTGRQVQGIVQELLTRGDHPRGIKVRLADGRVGRVQRMVQDDGGVAPDREPSMNASARQVYDRSADTSLSQEQPPPRTLADFVPAFQEGDAAPASLNISPNFSSANAKCPFCDYQGDEIAVSRHVEEHLT